MDFVSRKTSKSVATSLSINCHNNKVRYKIDCYILYTVLLAIILLLIITVIFYYCAKHRSKQKGVNALTIKKWKVMNSKKFV